MVFVVLGASESGKAALIQEFVRQGCVRVITNTTRPRCDTEAADAYNFLKHYEFQAKIAQGELLEYSEYAGYWYGTSAGSITDNSVISVETKGFYALKNVLPYKLYAIYLKVDSQLRTHRVIARGGSLIKFSYRLDIDKHRFDEKFEADADIIITNPRIDAYSELVQKCIEQSKRLVLV